MYFDVYVLCIYVYMSISIIIIYKLPILPALQLIPEGRWWGLLYCSSLNLLNFLLCVVGAELFGKTSLLILTLVGQDFVKGKASIKITPQREGVH